nr:11384 [Craspedostauros australis]
MNILAASLLAALGGTAVSAAPEYETVPVSKPTCAKPARSGTCHAAGLLNAGEEALTLAPEQPADLETVRVVLKQSFFEGQDIAFAGVVIPSIYTNGEPICIENFGPLAFGANLDHEGHPFDLMCNPATNTAKVSIYISDDKIDADKLDELAEDSDGQFPDECDLGEFVPTEMCSVTYEIQCGCSEHGDEEEEELADAEDGIEDDIEDAHAETEEAIDAHLDVRVNAAADVVDMEDGANIKRKLDAQLRPTPAPTSAPTSAPTRPKPTNPPSVSFEPTTSLAPTEEQGPGCDSITYLPEGHTGPLPFCYDGSTYHGTYRGNGRGRGKADTTCYVVEESECGMIDFMIQGANSMDNYRCSDVFDWYIRCVASYGCTPAHDSTVYFAYGKPGTRRVSWIGASSGQPGYYRFTLDGNGVWGGAYKWKCPSKEAAYGMKHFTDAVYNTKVPGDWRRLFQTPVGTCESSAPSESLVPTSSPAPSLPVPPDCTSDFGYHFPYSKPRTSNHVNRRSQSGPKGKIYIVVNKHCQYYMYGAGVQGTKYVNNMEEMVEGVAKAWGAQMVNNNAKFNPLGRMNQGMIISGNCGNQLWCTKTAYVSFRKHSGVENEDKIFLFDSRTYADRFRRLFYDTAKNDNEVFFTLDENNKCGVSPMCTDDGKTACYVDTKKSDFCGPFDFVVVNTEGDEQLRTNDVWEFFTDCAASWPSCTKYEYGTVQFVYGRSPRVHSWRSGGKRIVRLKDNGFKGEVQYHCTNNEQGLDLYHLAYKMYCTDLFKKKKSECTQSPTDSPTACQDSFLTKPPININIVMDISYSTYYTPFGGSWIGDLNGDGKRNSILDAEIAAVLQLLKVIENSDVLDNTNVDLGFVVFETSGFYKGEYMHAGRYKPLNSNGNGINSDLIKDLKDIQTLKTNATVIQNNKGFTNFDDALDKSIEYFMERENDSTINFDEWTNLMVFLSDGIPNIRGDGDNEPFCKHGLSNVNCNNPNARNKPDTAATLRWESGELSFCQSGDTGCADNKYKPCVLGPKCEGDDSVKMFGSEFKRLDMFGRDGVKRISIGVGKSSDGSMGSALYSIDNNPLKKTFPDLLPPVVTTTDALANLLRNLCYENTANPTDQPSVSPTSIPTTLPTGSPTHEPTSAPTSKPTSAPTSPPTGLPTSAPTDEPTETPSSQPTDDLCDYTVLDFAGETGPALPDTWTPTYGMRIMSMVSDVAGNLAYIDTNDAEAGVVLAVPKADSVVDEVSPDGGSILINQDLTQDKFMRISLYNVENEFKIIRRFREMSMFGEVVGTVASVDEHDAFTGVKEFKIPVDGIFQVEVQFEGHGSLSKLQICRNPNSTPAPFGLSSNGSTDPPTATPTTNTATPTMLPTVDDGCPPDAVVISTTGSTPFPQNPIEVVSQDGTTVTFKVKQTWKETVGYLYTNYQTSFFDSECILLEEVEKYASETYTAKCMDSVEIAVVDIYVSDPSLNKVLDDAVIPICCQKPDVDSHPTVKYTFEVKCVDPCPTPARKLSDKQVVGDEVDAKYSKKTIIKTDKDGKAETETSSTDHYCKPSEHPCSDDSSMVNVCHYSSKKGFQTYCMTAADSDIVSYYPNDSCGPCPPELSEKASVNAEVAK